MFRSLHMKLVMIMLLLVTSLMAVVGAFLMTSVTNFYIDDFYAQMSEVFGESNAAFVSSLREEAAQEDGVIGAFTGGVTATAGGVAAAIAFGYLFSLLFRSKTK